jgi:hypothetical protein
MGLEVLETKGGLATNMKYYNMLVNRVALFTGKYSNAVGVRMRPPGQRSTWGIERRAPLKPKGAAPGISFE